MIANAKQGGFFPTGLNGKITMSGDPATDANPWLSPTGVDDRRDGSAAIRGSHAIIERALKNLRDPFGFPTFAGQCFVERTCSLQ
jgi:hypothetical protein